jgi:hypothetical protein
VPATIGIAINADDHTASSPFWRIRLITLELGFLKKASQSKSFIDRDVLSDLGYIILFADSYPDSSIAQRLIFLLPHLAL